MPSSYRVSPTQRDVLCALKVAHLQGVEPQIKVLPETQEALVRRGLIEASGTLTLTPSGDYMTRYVTLPKEDNEE